MKNINAGRPTAGKKTLQVDDLKETLVRVSTDVSRETYKAIKQRALDEDKGILEMLREILEREFK